MEEKELQDRHDRATLVQHHNHIYHMGRLDSQKGYDVEPLQLRVMF